MWLLKYDASKKERAKLPGAALHMFMIALICS
jgi:hypothetical protein